MARIYIYYKISDCIARQDTVCERVYGGKEEK